MSDIDGTRSFEEGVVVVRLGGNRADSGCETPLCTYGSSAMHCPKRSTFSRGLSTGSTLPEGHGRLLSDAAQPLLHSRCCTAALDTIMRACCNRCPDDSCNCCKNIFIRKHAHTRVPTYTSITIRTHRHTYTRTVTRLQWYTHTHTRTRVHACTSSD